MRAIWGRMAGRKTYLLAGLVILAMFALVFMGRLTPETGGALMTLAAAGFAATFRDALERHQKEEIALLKTIAQAGAAAAAHNVAGALAAAEDALPQGVALAHELNQEKTS